MPFFVGAPGRAQRFAGKVGSTAQDEPPVVFKRRSRILSPRRGNRLLLTRLNSNLRLGDRIEPKSCCFGFPHEEGVPLFHKSWCCASSKAASCDSATCPPLQAEIRTRSRSAAPPRAFWPPCLGAANSSSPLESSAATSGKGCCGPAEIRLRPPFENYPTRCIFPLRGPGVHADSDPKSGVPDQAC